jgi:hypothetical protein
MNKIYNKSPSLLLLFLMLFLLSGCYATTNLKGDQPNSGYISPNQKNLPLACLVSITTSVDGSSQNVAITFPQKVTGKLQESRIFSNVESIVNGGNRPQKPFYELTLTANETSHSNRLFNAVKGFLDGASWFILDPILPLTMQFESKMTLKVIAPNMQEKEYQASQYGSLTCTPDISEIFPPDADRESQYGSSASTWPNCREGRIKLMSEIRESNLIYLVNQMAQDEWISVNSK